MLFLKAAVSCSHLMYVGHADFIALMGGNVSCSCEKNFEPPIRVNFILYSSTLAANLHYSMIIRFVNSFAILFFIIFMTFLSSKFPKHHMALTNAVSEGVLERGITPISKRSLPVS